MSEFFIPTPPWLKNGEAKDGSHDQYILKCNNCRLSFFAYNLPGRCPSCNGIDVEIKNNDIGCIYNSEQKK